MPEEVTCSSAASVNGTPAWAPDLDVIGRALAWFEHNCCQMGSASAPKRVRDRLLIAGNLRASGSHHKAISIVQHPANGVPAS